MKALVHTRAGLGNRIKTLVAAYRLTDDVTSTCNSFNVLLKNRIPVIADPATANYQLFTDWRFTIKDTDEIEKNFSTVYLQCCGEHQQNSMALDLEYFRIPEPVRKELAHTFSMLEACDRIQETVDRFTAGWGEEVIAVHVRSWPENPLRKQNLFDMNSFFRETDRRRNNLRIFVAADDPAIVDEFVDRYGSRVLSHPCGRPARFTHPYNTEETLVMAFTEMLCLSKGVILIGTYLSTFTECAWWFGGARQHVVIV